MLEQYTLTRVEMMTGVPAADIARLAGEFATNRPAVAILPTEPDGLDGEGVYAALAIHALNALVGSIDTPGGVLVQRFPKLADWPAFAGEQVLGIRDSIPNPQYPIPNAPYLNTLIVLNANPVYDRPDGGEWAQALQQMPFVVSFASTLDETAAHADVILPASTFLEVWGDDYRRRGGLSRRLACAGRWLSRCMTRATPAMCCWIWRRRSAGRSPRRCPGPTTKR